MASLSSSSVAIASQPSSSSRSYSHSASFLLPKTTARATRRPPPAVSVTAFYTSQGPAAPLNSASAATLYDLLELPKTASEAEIKTAYRRLARQYHPDVAPAEEKEGCTKRFLQIHSAYVALSDPEAKRRYDLQLRAIQGGGRPFTTSPLSFSSIGRGRSWETDQCWC